MIFEVSKINDLSKVAVSEIIEQISLIEFLKESQKVKIIPTCPVNAIDLDTNSINSNCNDCGLCWISNKTIITKKNSLPDYKKFKKQILNNKLFIYRWLSLSIEDYSGVEITSKGFSREKRIPLMVKSNNSIFLIKVIRNIADFEKAELEMQDVIELNRENLSKYIIKTIIIVIDDYNTIANSNTKYPIKLADIYHKIISLGKINIEEFI